MRSLFLLALLPFAGGAARADGLDDARSARALLGPGAWARVVRIENPPPRGLGRRLPYPETAYGLIFELSGILWFYSGADGTQSLSIRRGALAADKADPGPLLRAISPRFNAWSWVDEPAARPGSRPPPNACLLECLADLRRRIAIGAQADSPRLLFFYVDTPTGRLGHTVLLFGLAGGVAADDPDHPAGPIRLPAGLGDDARSIAAYLRGGPVAAVRVLPLAPPGPAPAAHWAVVPSATRPTG